MPLIGQTRRGVPPTSPDDKSQTKKPNPPQVNDHNPPHGDSVFLSGGGTGSSVSVWVKKNIEVIIVLEDGREKQKRLEAQCYGGIAVHPSTLDGKLWTVTSVTTGLLVCSVKTEDEAKQIGYILWDHACLAFRCVDWEDVIGNLPKWVRPWIRACRSVLSYVDYKTYVKVNK